jgi:hypothetical protein
VDGRADVSSTGLPATEAGEPLASLIGVYRRRNASSVAELVSVTLERGWPTAWWALDELEPDLARVTVGEGRGTRLSLLNELAGHVPQQGYLVVSDDDVIFTRGSLHSLVVLCDRARLDLAQPARSDDNSRFELNVAHAITRARRLSRVRLTTFVETGPLVVVGPSWRDRILPFPEERGMGWGVELDWHELWKGGCVLGIVDAVRVAHLGDPGSEYDATLEATRIHEELARRRYEGWKDLQRTVGIWRPWTKTPPWLRSGWA